MPLEKIIRPYTQANISPPKTTVAPRSTNQPGTVSFVIGARGTVKTVTLTYSASATAYDVKKPTEKSL